MVSNGIFLQFNGKWKFDNLGIRVWQVWLGEMGPTSGKDALGRQGQGHTSGKDA